MFLANFRAGRRSRYCRHDDWLETFWTGLIRLRPGSRSELRVIKLSATGVCALASSCNVAMEVDALGLGECGFQPEIPSHGRALQSGRTARRLPDFTQPVVPQGGLEGGGALGYVGGLIKACAFGLRVAEHAAERQG